MNLLDCGRTPIWWRASLVALVVATGACADDLPSVTTDGSSTGTSGDATTINMTTVDPDSGTGTSADTTMGSLDTSSSGSESSGSESSGSESSGSESSGGSSSSGGPECGNDVVEAGEDCDGAELDGADCMSLGFTGGRLACAADCTFDVSACSDAACGNDVIEGAEVCDGADLGGADCVSEGFVGGVLACAGDCSGYDTAACMAGLPCQDEDIGGMVGLAVTSGDTTGDDDDLAGSCGGMSGNDRVILFTAPADGDYVFDTFGSGYDTKLSLFSDCVTEISCNDDAGGGLQSELMLSMLAGESVLVVVDGFNGDDGPWVLNIDTFAPPVCGDGMAEPPGEECDGADLMGEDCMSLGFAGGGVLACDGACAFDTTGCIAGMGGTCCSPHAGMGCEDPGCEAAICGADPFCCDTQWDGLCADAALAEPACLGVSDCPGMGVCGNGVSEAPEVCDGADVGGMTCADAGLPGGATPVGCAMDCSAYDVGPCGGPAGYGNCIEFAEADVCIAGEEICATDGASPVNGVCIELGCGSTADCAPVPGTGNPELVCSDITGDGMGDCYLSCAMGETCPNGMNCIFGVICLWPES